MTSDFVTIKNKLDSIDEELDTTTLSVPIRILKEGTKITRMELPNGYSQGFVLEIPEGTTCVSGLDWVFYSVMPGTGRYAVQVTKIVFPSSITEFKPIFMVQPQYTINLTFKCDVVDVFMNMASEDSSYTASSYNKIMKAKDESKKQELFERWLSTMLGIPYTRTEFDFEVPLDFSAFYPIDLHLGED